MSETPQESEQTDAESPPSDPFADPAEQSDDDEERTADPDLGVQDAREVPVEPDNPVDPDPDPTS
jgi:hypothetical protein